MIFSEREINMTLLSTEKWFLDLGTVSLKRTCLRCSTYILVFISVLTLLAKSLESHPTQSRYEANESNEKNYELLKREFRARNDHLHQQCKKYPHLIPFKALNQAKFFYLKQPDVMMCMIPKVASTSLSSFLIQSHQHFKSLPDKGLTNIGFPSGSLNDTFQDTYKIMVVRHPLERLLSAYLYVFVKEVQGDLKHTNMYSNLTHLLALHYRGSHSWDVNPLLTFPEFVRFIVNGTKEHIPGSWQGLSNGDFIFNPNLNSHWEPYWKVCSPCQLQNHPSIILKFGKDFDQEVQYALKESGIQEFFTQRVHPKLQGTLQWKNSGQTELLEEFYFSQLSKAEVLQLYQAYKVDHDLFRYDVEPYLSFSHG
ncbi:carbohydrate sulfotransferase 11-like isoform X2 [Tigriopus californicus]|uniref:carbohydrate sulfotransferase 11-like isoform X2 n=1 Tax=Tigriopus californicus TaxID=6832 RepID=UPI0027D9D2E6|nr:carbohydrate sulfotransferase 11-like isoform X2 [Tigriopus californicus]